MANRLLFALSQVAISIDGTGYSKESHDVTRQRDRFPPRARPRGTPQERIVHPTTRRKRSKNKRRTSKRERANCRQAQRGDHMGSENPLLFITCWIPRRQRSIRTGTHHRGKRSLRSQLARFPPVHLETHRCSTGTSSSPQPSMYPSSHALGRFLSRASHAPRPGDNDRRSCRKSREVPYPSFNEDPRCQRHHSITIIDRRQAQFDILHSTHDTIVGGATL